MYVAIVLATILVISLQAAAEDRLKPVISSEWWTVAHNPDLGELSTEHQQPVDFAIWRAEDGTWQLWSCIRNTNSGGMTRLFYGWEGQALTNRDWDEKGIVWEADAALGETPGGMQAPHVIKADGKYVMAYGDWENICFAESKDGKCFERRIRANGRTGAFGEGAGFNSRDAMLLYTKNRWYCYYTAFPRQKGYDFCRTSIDLQSWSESCVVAYGGKAGNNMFSCECPHVVEVQPGRYVLFRTQVYGPENVTSVYYSTNPLNFGVDDDAYWVCQLPVAAPEIILHDNQYYIAALRPDLQGIRIAKLRWDNVSLEND